MTHPALVIAAEPFDSAIAGALVAALDADLDTRYPGGEGNVPVVLEPHEFDDPEGEFLVAWDGAVAVGCGGVRRVNGDTAEIKRMYVVPAARGRGISSAILRALEEAARRLGFRTLILETGVNQPEAMALYQRAGYSPVPCFEPYTRVRLSRCFTKVLDAE
jgi:GNAT superfamily N-acetyltransferase